MFKCTICLSPEEDLGATPCGHIFCISCLSRHLESIPHCPKCRKPCIIELVLRLHADFDDDATTSTHSSSTTHPPPKTEEEERSEHCGSEAMRIDSLANLTADLSLNVRDGYSHALGAADLRCIKLEEEEDERNTLQLPQSASEAPMPGSRDAIVASELAALSVKASLTNLVATVTSLLTRLKYSFDLTNYVEEAAYYLGRIVDNTKEKIQLDEDIRQATRERDASTSRYLAANDRMISRLKRYRDEKEVYLKKQLEFAQEREINVVQIVRLEGAVNAMRNKADKYETRVIALGGECDSSDEDDELEWESYSVWKIDDNITNSMPGAFPDVDGSPPRKRAREGERP